KDGIPPAGSATLTGLSGAAGAGDAGDARRALCGDSVVASFGAATGGGGAGRAVAGGAAAAICTPGMTSRAPTLSCAFGGRLLALAISRTDLPYKREILWS